MTAKEQQHHVPGCKTRGTKLKGSGKPFTCLCVYVTRKFNLLRIKIEKVKKKNEEN